MICTCCIFSFFGSDEYLLIVLLQLCFPDFHFVSSKLRLSGEGQASSLTVSWRRRGGGLQTFIVVLGNKRRSYWWECHVMSYWIWTGRNDNIPSIYILQPERRCLRV